MRVQEKIWWNKSVGLYIRAWLIKLCEAGLELCLFILLSIYDTYAQWVKWTAVRLKCNGSLIRWVWEYGTLGVCHFHKKCNKTVPRKNRYSGSQKKNNKLFDGLEMAVIASNVYNQIVRLTHILFWWCPWYQWSVFVLYSKACVCSTCSKLSLTGAYIPSNSWQKIFLRSLLHLYWHIVLWKYW